MSDDITGDARTDVPEIAAPELAYLPPTPKDKHMPIGLIGCGGIAPFHLAAYRAQGFNVVALCDLDTERAASLAREHFPDAAVVASAEDLIAREDIAVLDIATHPEVRVPIIEAALRAGKHVLSQKPFVKDLDEGRRLIDLAAAQGRKLAVNQNGRWAPQFSYIRHAVAAGHIGRVTSIQCTVHWDHSWTAGTDFDNVPHLILYDFGIHWFDIASVLMGPDRIPESVYAIARHSPGQKPKPPMIAAATIAYDDGLVSLAFHGAVEYGASDTTRVTGTNGVIESRGPDLNHQTVTLHTAEGRATPSLQGDWFTNGFQGTMGELLCAIEHDREPSNTAASVLPGLAACFAATESADAGAPVTAAYRERS